MRHIERVRGVSYPAVVEHTRSLLEALRAGEPQPELALVLDYTGVGRPVADMIAAAKLDAKLRLVTITGGDAVTQGERGEWRVPKRDLAGVVQLLLQSGRLRIGEGLPLAGTLTQELKNFRVKINLAGHDSYGVVEEWRAGNHDDLVLALALACWWGERLPRPVTTPILAPGGGTVFPLPAGMSLSRERDEVEWW